MTSLQMEYLGIKQFQVEEDKQIIRLALYVDNVGDVPILIQLKDGKFDSAKVFHLLELLLILLDCV